MKPLVEIMKLNQHRYGVGFDFTKAVEKLEEELQEFKDAYAEDDIDGMIDALNDLKVIASGEEVKLGYNPELCLKQTVKEISSREQCPEQTKAWNAGLKEPGEKWLKNPNQDPETLYTANFSTCKLTPITQ
jgi:hypothetical protein